MKLDDILFKYINKNKYSRQVGRYWATDINSIKRGYLTPQSFFEKSDIGIDGCRMILTGQASEDMLTRVFEETGVDFKAQEKKVLPITDEIDLVVKPDYVFPDWVLETKFPFSQSGPQKIPQRYCYQLECEHRAFERPVFLGKITAPFNVEFIPYKPSKRRWNNIQKTLKQFHEDVKKEEEKRKNS